MKRNSVIRNWSFVMALFLLSSPLYGREDGGEALCHSPWGVNAHPYTYSSSRETPTPRGYRPFYVSHYGRHGSRADMGSRYYPLLDSILTSMRQQGIWDSTHDSLWHLLKRVDSAYAGADRRLLPLGQREQAGIAERMYRRTPQLFRHGTIRAVSSVVPRCLMSMTAFSNALTAQCPTVNWQMDCGEHIQPVLNCRGPLALTYELIPKVIDSLVYTADITTYDRAVYQLAVYARLYGIEASPYDYLPQNKVARIEAYDTYHFYLNFCNTRFGHLRYPYAQRGLNDIICRADSVIGGNRKVVADLRFGHDDPLLCLVAMMHIRGVGSALSEADILDQWPAWKYICMASNVQLIYYRNKQGDVLVKVLYNEQECLLDGVETVSGCYYRWNDVRALWLNSHRFATYNVRYVNPKNGDTGDKYWGNRREYVIRNVLDNHFDIVGMQEVTGNNRDSLTGTSQLEDLQQGLAGYDCIAYERNDKRYSYNAIFYRRDRYECVRHFAFWLSETPNVPSYSWGSRFYRRCVVAIMRDKTTGQEFVFANAHTDYEPQEAGLRQAQLLADTLPVIAGGRPLILVGDLNHDRLQDPQIYATYRKTLNDMDYPWFPTYQKWRTVRDADFMSGKQIDFLFYRNMTPLNRVVVTEDFGRSVAPSDHFPIYTDFQLVAPPLMDPIR